MGGYDESVEKKCNQKLLKGFDESIVYKLSKISNEKYNSLTSQDKENITNLLEEDYTGSLDYKISTKIEEKTYDKTKKKFEIKYIIL